MNRQGEMVGDLLIVFVFFFFMIMVVFIGMKIMNSQADSLGQSDKFGQTVDVVRDGTATGFNTGVLMAIGIMFVAAVLSTFYLDTNPAFIWIGFFIGSFALWLLFGMSDTIDSTLPASLYQQEISQMPQARSAGTGVWWVMLGVFVLMMVGLYAKTRFAPG